MKIQEKIFWGLSLATSVLALACSSTEDTNAGIGGYNNPQGIAAAGTAGLNPSAPGQGGITTAAAGGTTGTVAQAGAGGATPKAGAGGTKTGGAGGIAGRAGTGGKAGKGGASGKSGAGGKGGTGGTAGRGECPKSTLTGDQVVFLGDSYLATLTSQIAPNLEALWQKDGSPAYSANPRWYQVVGTTMSQIVDQYTQAKNDNPNIKLVIMDGGGNDALILNQSCLSSAPPGNASCVETMDNIHKLHKQLLEQQEKDGVEHVVFFSYPHTPDTMTYPPYTKPAGNDTSDYDLPLSIATCEGSPICNYVWLGEAAGEKIGSGYEEQGLIGPDGVHPSEKGSQVFAEYIWKKMKENCIAWK